MKIAVLALSVATVASSALAQTTIAGTESQPAKGGFHSWPHRDPDVID